MRAITILSTEDATENGPARKLSSFPRLPNRHEQKEAELPAAMWCLQERVQRNLRTSSCSESIIPAGAKAPLMMQGLYTG
jgi:hypothetical protein